MSLILERVLVTASRTLARLRMLQEQRVAMSLILGIIKLSLVEVIDLLNGRALELLLLQLRLRLMELPGLLLAVVVIIIVAII